jgi:hypothetical protein
LSTSITPKYDCCRRSRNFPTASRLGPVQDMQCFCRYKSSQLLARAWVLPARSIPCLKNSELESQTQCASEFVVRYFSRATSITCASSIRESHHLKRSRLVRPCTMFSSCFVALLPSDFRGLRPSTSQLITQVAFFRSGGDLATHLAFKAHRV